MKRNILFAIALAFPCFVIGQEGSVPRENIKIVKNIQAAQMDEFRIRITYDLHSANSQIFSITIYASINGASKKKLKGVTGDVGESIVGGKSNYVVIWDVFEDTDRLESVEFYIHWYERS